jgi:hypothetical protein
MAKDWIDNKKSTFVTLGASNHTDKERQREDYYATDPIAASLLLEVEPFEGKIWECACGEKHLAKVFEDAGYEVRSSDIVDRCGNEVFDFLGIENYETWEGNIITNPPYKYATEFIYKSLSIIPKGYKVAMFLKVQFMEGKERKYLFTEFPPKVIYVSSSRIMCAKNGEFEKMREGGGSAVAYAWYVWEKGYKGDTKIKWIN